MPKDMVRIPKELAQKTVRLLSEIGGPLYDHGYHKEEDCLLEILREFGTYGIEPKKGKVK